MVVAFDQPVRVVALDEGPDLALGMGEIREAMQPQALLLQRAHETRLSAPRRTPINKRSRGAILRTSRHKRDGTSWAIAGSAHPQRTASTATRAKSRLIIDRAA